MTVRTLAALVLACTVLSSGRALAGEVLYADGRTAVALDPRQGSDGGWTAEMEGHRVRLVPGRVVALIDDEGQEQDLIPTLGDAPLSDQAKAALAALREAGNSAWMVGFESIAIPPTRAVFEDVVELAKSKDKALRLRAVRAMTLLPTRESVTAAAEAVLAEKHKATRRDAASALFSVREIFVRSDAMQSVATGIEDGDRTVRVVFALLGAGGGDDAVLEVLRKDGIRSSDHHIREEAAVALGKQGDASGLKILKEMLARQRVPGTESLSEEARTTLLVNEQVEICRILGALGDHAALAALRKATGSKHEAVSLAAKDAIAKLEGSEQD